jgi:site-specific DNA-methyltransferase (adenine-specific)
VINKVYYAEALELLAALPTASISNIISDWMYGAPVRYDWGTDPANGDPLKHWAYHQPVLDECRRVLVPGGVLAICQGFKFRQYFDSWFGPHRIWSPQLWHTWIHSMPHGWIVQTREQQPVEHPNDMIVPMDQQAFKRLKELKKYHPVPKTIEEMRFLVRHLTKPGEIILDPFCGLGGTLVAAHQLGRSWIGGDKSRTYCQVSMKRLEDAGYMFPRLLAPPLDQEQPRRLHRSAPS